MIERPMLQRLSVISMACLMAASCNRDVSITANSDLPSYGSAAAYFEGARPTGTIRKGSRLPVIDCIDMKSSFALEVPGVGGNRRFIVDGIQASTSDRTVTARAT